MAGADDEIEKAVNIIIATKGTKEATKEVSDMHDAAHKGQEQLQRDAKKSTDANELFIRKWKNSLLMITGALGSLYALTKYSPVAASMIDLVGVSLGYLATVILIPLLPYVLTLSDYIFKAADAFDKLPTPVKTVTALLLGLYGAYKLLKGLGVVDLAVKVASTGLDILKWVFDKVKGPLTQIVNVVAKEAAGGIEAILAKWAKLIAAGGATGGLAFAAAFLGAVAVGWAIGAAIVSLMDYLGITKAIAKFGDDCLSKQPAIRDALKVLFAPFAIETQLTRDIIRGGWREILDDILTGDISKIPGDLVTGFSKIPEDIQGILDQVSAILDKFKIPPGFLHIIQALAAIPVLGTSLAPLTSLLGGTASTADLAQSGIKLSTDSTDPTTGITRNATTGTKTYPSGITVPYNPATDTDNPSNSLSPVATRAATAVTNQSANTAATAATASANTALGVFDTVANVAKGIMPGLGTLQGIVDTVAKVTTSSPIPQYAAGGYVASDQIAQLHKGDWIRSKYGDTTRDSTGRTDKGNSGTTISGPITIVTQSKNPEEIYRYVTQRLQQTTRSRV